jgi:predicted enzyme related to lactoylglutathione lyase
LREAQSIPGASVGLLKGFADIREFYRVTGELLVRVKEFHELAHQIPEEARGIDTSNLLGVRPRLDFIDYLPSPQPWAGRSAAILYNRLSNAAEEPSLLGPEFDDGRVFAPAMFNWAKAARKAGRNSRHFASQSDFRIAAGGLQADVSQPCANDVFAVDDIDETLERLRRRGAQLVGEVVQYKDAYRLCYIRGPEGILIGLAQELS